MNWGSKMNKPELTDTELDALFAASRSQTAAPSPDFLARIAEDAAAAAQTAARPSRPVVVQRSLWDRLRAAVSHIALPGSVVTAGLMGLWIGISPPQFLPDPVLILSGTDTTSAALGLEDAWFSFDTEDSTLWEDG